MRGGDDDLPARPSLAARRAKTDVLRVRQAAATAGSDDEVPTLVGKRSRGDEDEFYQVRGLCVGLCIVLERVVCMHCGQCS